MEAVNQTDEINLIIAFVAPIGTDLDQVATSIESIANSLQFEIETVRISDLFSVEGNLKGFARYKALMDEGDRLRRDSKRDYICAVLAMARIKEIRQVLRDRRVIVVIRQLKTPTEIATLRQVYGNRLFVIAAYSSRPNRVQSLSRLLADHDHEIQVQKYRPDAETLILRDEADESNTFGQNVRKAFPQADFFVNIDDRANLEGKLRRALHLLYGHPFITPTREEFGMYQAEAVALRSAALGRQVGAVIATTNGDVIAVGANEVPKAGGGLYWENDEPDRRDFTTKTDSNDVFKERVLVEIIKRFKSEGWLSKAKCDLNIEDLLTEALKPDHGILDGSQLDNIIEFGRCVHAEMAAIVDAARRGVSIDKSVLFTTTFPCHECARHIVAAGIQRVYFRVPYPKSLVKELYPDSIDVDGDGGADRIHFVPFEGIAPRRYMQLFRMRKRKDDRGNICRWPEFPVDLTLGDDYIPSKPVIEPHENLFIIECDLRSLGKESENDAR